MTDQSSSGDDRPAETPAQPPVGPPPVTPPPVEPPIVQPPVPEPPAPVTSPPVAPPAVPEPPAQPPAVIPPAEPPAVAPPTEPAVTPGTSLGDEGEPEPVGAVDTGEEPQAGSEFAEDYSGDVYAADPYAAGAYSDEEFGEEFGEVAVDTSAPWVGVINTLGAGLVAIVTVQVFGALIEGASLKKGERISNTQFQVADDLLHRLGYPFFNLVTPTLIILVIGVALLALPWVLGWQRTATQEAIARLALWFAVAMGIVLGLGSMLAVRASLHEYAVKNISVPRFLRINYTSFLLVTLGTAALSVFGAVATILHSNRQR